MSAASSDEQLTCHQASRLGSNGMGNLLGHQRKEDSMSRARKQKTQPYLPTILERLDQAQGELKPGSLYTIDVLHDDCARCSTTQARATATLRSATRNEWLGRRRIESHSACKY